MLQEKHKTRIVISFGMAAFFILFTLVSSWNAFAKEYENLGFWPLLGAILSIVALGELFRIAYKNADTTKLEEYVQLQVSEGKAKILAEIKAKEEKDKEKTETISNDDEILKKIIPSGNFKNIESFSKKLLVNVANSFNLVQGVFYIYDNEKEQYIFSSGYALNNDYMPASFKAGENINGQVAEDKKLLVVDEIPPEYLAVESGLGDAKPGVLYFVPVVSNDTTIGLFELASFNQLTETQLKTLEQITVLSSTKIEKIVKA